MDVFEDIKTLSLRLLEREPSAEPVVTPSCYRTGSLLDLLASLSRPDTPVDGAVLASLCLKYSFAYLYPESCADAVPLEDVTQLAGQFVRRRGGSRGLRGRDQLRRLLLHHGFALQMLFDIPKTAHLLATLLQIPAGVRHEFFLGLDLGAGTGILLLGQYLRAKRLGYDAPCLLGVEHLSHVATRANTVLARLGIGRVVQADATQPGVYSGVPPGPLSCVTNETLPSVGRRLYKEPFTAISAALFGVLGSRLKDACFLPEAVWASDRHGASWLRLAPDNAFAGPAGADKPLRLYFMRDVELAGRRMPADRVGEGWMDLVSPSWRATLCRRW